MATRRYGISVGQAEEEVTEGEGAAVDADLVEVTVELDADEITVDGVTTRAISKAEVLDSLDKIKNHIIKSNWPPA